MDLKSVAAAMQAKQLAYPRHAAIMREATPLPENIVEMSIVTCFEQQVTRTPQRLALSAQEGSLTYEELNAAANRLAHHLLATGIAITAPVTILLNSSLPAFISMLAVLKIGGYYLCLEPNLPIQRGRDLANRAATRMILTISTHAAYAEEIAPDGCDCLLLDQMAASDRAHNPGIPISPLQPSHVRITSGTTGAPKTLLKNHQAALYSVLENVNIYGLAPADRFACALPFGTGSSERENYSALLTGASLHLHPGLNSDINSWATWIDSQAITQLTLPTASFRELLHTRPDGCNFPSLRRVSTGGQTVHRQDAELFQRRFCRGTIMNITYAMTEAASISHYIIDHDTIFEGESLPIGYALPGREILILDEEGHPLGFNQPGEIAVRTYYTNMQDRNGGGKSEGGGPPFFHTADLGLQRPDGCLIHLGRKDDMVKIRGNRVALAEAENLLLKVGGVAQAAVKGFPIASGDNRLVGYVTPASDAQITVSDVREEMSLFAPSYMVPARIVILPAMPLTATGKVDRNALPPPPSTRPELAIPFIAPANELELQIAAIWEKMLEVDEIGAHDNFFDLGGDSLTAMRMILKVETSTGATIPQDYFHTPTVAALAAYCASNPSIVASATPSHPLSNPLGNSGASTPALAQQPSAQHALTRLAKGQLTTTNAVRGMINQRLLGLTYRQGVRWLAWLGQPAIAERLFSNERQWFRTFVQEMEIPIAATGDAFDKAFAASMGGNLIRHNLLRSRLYRNASHGDLIKAMLAAPERFWRTFAQEIEQPTQDKSQDQGESLFHFSGLEHLVYAQKRKQGTILLTYHGVASPLENVMLARQTNLGHIRTISLERTPEMAEEIEETEWREDGPNDGEESGAAGWAAIYALQAQRILQKGGVIRIANDVSYDAANSLPKTIGRRQYNLKPGFADLALTTGATVLPVYSEIDATGRIHLTILPALSSQASDDSSRTHELMDRYITFLEATWRKVPESLGWGSLQRYTTRPLAVAPLRPEPAVQLVRG